MLACLHAGALSLALQNPGMKYLKVYLMTGVQYKLLGQKHLQATISATLKSGAKALVKYQHKGAISYAYFGSKVKNIYRQWPKKLCYQGDRDVELFVLDESNNSQTVQAVWDTRQPNRLVKVVGGILNWFKGGKGRKAAVHHPDSPVGHRLQAHPHPQQAAAATP